MEKPCFPCGHGIPGKNKTCGALPGRGGFQRSITMPDRKGQQTSGKMHPVHFPRCTKYGVAESGKARRQGQACGAGGTLDTAHGFPAAEDNRGKAT